jgi:ferredoxin-NADP reductase
MVSWVAVRTRHRGTTLGAVMSNGAPKVQEFEAELTVARRESPADGVVTLSLQDPAGGPLPGWTPGAHIDLMLNSSLVRQYSLCSSPADTSAWTVGVLRDPESRGGSRLVHDELHEGSRVRVRGPRNHFPIVSSPCYEFIAGGIGITPMLPMIEAAEAAGADWHLLYGGRQRASMAFVDRLAAHGDRVAIWPQDERGLLDLASVIGTPREDTLVYCCGPEGLLSAVEDACAPWPSGALRIERFAAKSQPDEPPDGALESFEVVCQRSGITVTVSADESILDVLQNAGVNMLASCMEGICGTCEAEVIDGTPHHRDSVLTDDEKAANDVMMTCVSRSMSERLVLDL